MNPTDTRAAPRPRSGRWKLFAILAVCAAPLVASYLAYYVIKPAGRTNYGDLIDPRVHPIPAALTGRTLDGRNTSLQDFHGKWILLQVGSGDCNAACQERLFEMRQLRLTQGREMDRIERVWLITDEQPIDTLLLREYDGTRFLRVDDKVANAWLPANAGTRPSDHLYMIDPLGNLMMRFPKDADPNRIEKDIARLLRASGIG